MESISSALEKATGGPEFAHLQRRPSVFQRVTKKIFELYCRLFLFRIWCPVAVKGRENIPKSSFIFCSNHNSHMDTGVLMNASGLPFEKFGMMAAADYFFNNKLRKVVLGLLMNLIPIDREPDYKAMIDMLAGCREFTKNGTRSIILYPEGTRSVTGKIQKFKRGAAMIATELRLPMVPVYIEGTHRSMPKGRSFMKPKKIRVTIGKPIHPDPFINENCNGRKTIIYRQLTEELEKNIHRLMENNLAAD